MKSAQTLRLVLAFVPFFLAAPLMAEVTVAPLFRDHAVLQRDKPVPIWGTAAPGAKVSVAFGAQTKTATVDAAGSWQVTLDPLSVSAEPQDLLVRDETTVHRSKDILVGDVWLCSGQSNMGFRVSRADNAAAEMAAATFPAIRWLDVPMEPSAAPTRALKSLWTVCSPETAGQVSAVAFYFARDMHRVLGVPIGLITSAWGGTQIESWMDDATLKNDPAYGAIAERWQVRLAGVPEEMRRHAVRLERQRLEKEKAAADGVAYVEPPLRKVEGELSRWTPSGLYNGMIHPLVPAALRGVIWYQGESNADRPAEYASLFPAMIGQWRRAFGQEDLPFYFVQIANWKKKGDDIAVAYLREAQTKALELPATGMAVTIDVGNPDDVHPTNKQAVGKRLALVALSKSFGKPEPFSGPVFREAKFEPNRVKVIMDHQGPFTLQAGQPNGFEIAGKDQIFHPADAAVEEGAIVVSSAAVPEPVAARYAFRNAPPSTLSDDTRLPAPPFRTDNWPYVPPAPVSAK